MAAPLSGSAAAAAAATHLRLGQHETRGHLEALGAREILASAKLVLQLEQLLRREGRPRPARLVEHVRAYTRRAPVFEGQRFRGRKEGRSVISLSGPRQMGRQSQNITIKLIVAADQANCFYISRARAIQSLITFMAFAPISPPPIATLELFSFPFDPICRRLKGDRRARAQS